MIAMLHIWVLPLVMGPMHGHESACVHAQYMKSTVPAMCCRSGDRAAHRVGKLGSDPDVLILIVDILSAADFDQDLASLVVVAAFHQGVGRLRQEHASQSEDDRGDAGQSQRCTPALILAHVLGACMCT